MKTGHQTNPVDETTPLLQALTEFGQSVVFQKTERIHSAQRHSNAEERIEQAIENVVNCSYWAR